MKKGQHDEHSTRPTVYKDPRWVKVEGNKVKIGIADFAQHEITDVVHVELPEAGRVIKKEQPAAVVESVKSAFDIYAPASGKVVEVNDKVLGSPELVNNSPYENGYLFVIEVSDEKD
ncbi:MAG: glycine cleavage system protein GcvH [Endomicrobium sp.]|nr:glycine cleavage system protein GcvH [Endomicrobium sp.]